MKEIERQSRIDSDDEIPKQSIDRSESIEDLVRDERDRNIEQNRLE